MKILNVTEMYVNMLFNSANRPSPAATLYFALLAYFTAETDITVCAGVMACQSGIIARKYAIICAFQKTEKTETKSKTTLAVAL